MTVSVAGVAASPCATALDADSSASAKTFGLIPPSDAPVQLATSNAVAAPVGMAADPTNTAARLRRTMAARSPSELIRCIFLLSCAADSAAQRQILARPPEESQGEPYREPTVRESPRSD